MPHVVADISLAMLKRAARKPGISAVHSQIERWPIADGSFTRIVMVDALHHVIDKQATAGELQRVLQAGGRIVIEEPDIRRVGLRIVALLEKMALMCSHFLNSDETTKLFTDEQARVTNERERFNTWVVVEKLCFDQ